MLISKCEPNIRNAFMAVNSMELCRALRVREWVTLVGYIFLVLPKQQHRIHKAQVSLKDAHERSRSAKEGSRIAAWKNDGVLSSLAQRHCC